MYPLCAVIGLTGFFLTLAVSPPPLLQNVRGSFFSLVLTGSPIKRDEPEPVSLRRGQRLCAKGQLVLVGAGGEG